ncbi:MAG: collagen-like protein, partial [Bacteroidota bacterium]
QGLKGDLGPQGSQGLKGDKGDRGPQGLSLFPVSSTNVTDGSTVCLLSTGGATSVTVVRTGSAGSFRIVVSEGAIDDCPYSATWDIVTGETLTVGAVNDVAISLVPKTIDVGTSRRFTMMFRFGSKWAKLELFRQNSLDVNWYGFVSNN